MSNLYTTKKALKIATALYMVTDIMSEKEPLKWHLRTCAVALLEADTRNIKSIVERTLDILVIAKIARAVSQMNATVLEEELRTILAQSIDTNLEDDATTKLFGKDFFEVTLEIEEPKKEMEISNIKDTPPIVKNEAEVPKVISTTPAIKNEEIKDTQKIEPKVHVEVESISINVQKREEPKEDRSPDRPATTLIPQGIRSAFMPRITLVDSDIMERQARSDDTRTSRRDIILNTIREKDNCSIKDITSKLGNVSEKTIQRELVAMTEEGILTKTGDRRWSTYSLGHTPLI